MELLRPEARLTLVMVIPAYEDPRLDEGGFEGPVITYEQADKDWARTTAQGRSALDRTAAALGPDVEIRLVSDDEPPGAAIVRFAEEMRADVLVIGSPARVGCTASSAAR